MSSIESLFCLEVCGKERNEESKASVTVSMTYEWRAVKPQMVSSVGGLRLRISHSHAHDPPLAYVAFFFAFFPHRFSSKRGTAHSLCLQAVSLLEMSENSCFFIDLIVMDHFEWT